MNTNTILKLCILSKFRTQVAFAEAINSREEVISRTIHGRRKLTKEEADIWIAALDCDKTVLEPVIQR